MKIKISINKKKGSLLFESARNANRDIPTDMEHIVTHLLIKSTTLHSSHFVLFENKILQK